jgi:hypothetical protein
MMGELVRPRWLVVHVVVWPALAAMLVHLGLAIEYTIRHGGDPSALVGASQERVGRFPFEAISTALGPQSYGRSLLQPAFDAVTPGCAAARSLASMGLIG